MLKLYTVHGHITFDGKDIPFTCEQHATSRQRAKELTANAFVHIDSAKEIVPSISHYGATPICGYYSSPSEGETIHVHTHKHDDGSADHDHAHAHQDCARHHSGRKMAHIHA